MKHRLASAVVGVGVVVGIVLIAVYGFCLTDAKPATNSAPAEPLITASGTHASATQQWIEQDAHGVDCVRDGSGHLIPVAAYTRVICLSAAVDAFLVQAIDAERMIGYSTYSLGRAYAAPLLGKKTFRHAKEIEGLLSLHPDLIIAPSSAAGLPEINRLREAGCTVFNVGEARGMTSFCHYTRQLSALLGCLDTGDAIIQGFIARTEGIAAALPLAADATIPSVLYLSSYSGTFYGGVRGSSFHDVISYAGLRDASDVQQWRSSWPQYSVEQLIILNPDYIICHKKMAQVIASHAALQDMKALSQQHLIEIDSDILNDPGFGIYHAAQHLATYVHASEQARTE